MQVLDLFCSYPPAALPDSGPAAAMAQTWSARGLSCEAEIDDVTARGVVVIQG